MDSYIPKDFPPNISNFINNEYVAPNNSLYIDNISPATSLRITGIPRSTEEDVNRAVVAAQAAFPSWNALSYKQRADYLDRIADLLETRLEEWAALESLDTGKPLALTRSLDIPRAVENFRYYASHVRNDRTDCHITGGNVADEINTSAVNYTYRKGSGIGGIIVPWNLPLYLLTFKLAACLASGCVAVLKPSELTPLTAWKLGQLCQEVSLPPGVVNIVHGYGAECGNALVGHPLINRISFTGGTATGRIVAATAAPLFKRVSLEMGGKNSAVVFADCDYEKTIDTLWRSSFLNQGQICLCNSRIFVQDEIYDRVLTDLVARCEATRPGDPRVAGYGAVISQQHLEKIMSYIELGRVEGEIACGGYRVTENEGVFSNGYFIQPTIITNASPSSRCSQEEIFGPVAVLHRFSTEEEVLELVNGVEYGLAGSLFTGDLKRGHRFPQLWNTGMVWVNTWLYRDLRVPFGGVKSSGVGVEGGDRSIEFWSDIKNICIKL